MILGETLQTVEFGLDGTPVQALPIAGYVFINWSDGVTSNPRIDRSISGDISVYANFDINLNLNEEIEQEVKIYPVPTVRDLNIDIPFHESFDVFIMNSIGQMVTQLSPANPGNNNYNISGLSPGVYFVQLISPTKRLTRKIIKGYK